MIQLYGHSDDCFEVEGDFRGENEYNSFLKPISVVVHDFTFDTSVIVTAEYGKRSAVWSISVEPIDEDKPMPNISIAMAKNGYSPMLVIDCSENTAVSELKGGE